MCTSLITFVISFRPCSIVFLKTQHGTLPHLLASSVDRDVNGGPVGRNWLRQWFRTLNLSFTFTFFWCSTADVYSRTEPCNGSHTKYILKGRSAHPGILPFNWYQTWVISLTFIFSPDRQSLSQWEYIHLTFRSEQEMSVRTLDPRSTHTLDLLKKKKPQRQTAHSKVQVSECSYRYA